MSAYTPRTGIACGCRAGVQRDNCPNCEGTGQAIDFKAIHAARASVTLAGYKRHNCQDWGDHAPRCGYCEHALDVLAARLRYVAKRDKSPLGGLDLRDPGPGNFATYKDAATRQRMGR